MSFRKHPGGLNRPLLQRFGGKVGQVLAVQLWRRRHNWIQMKCRATPVLTVHSGTVG